MKQSILLLFLVTISISVFSQKETVEKLPFIRLNYQAGGVLPTNKFLKGDNASGQPINSYHAGAIELGFQTNGSKSWHHAWGMPAIGIGFYTADFINDEELGKPAAIYGFFNNTLKQWGRFGIHFEGGAGLTFNWKPYDPEINPANVAIGSYNTVYLDFGLKAQWFVAQNLQLDFGYTFTHFSNGATTLPNMGINMTGPKISAAYHFKGNQPTFHQLPEKEFIKKNEFVADLKFSTKQVKFDTSITGISTQYLGINYNVYGLSLGYLRYPTEKWKYGAGIETAYDNSASAQLDVVDGVYNPVQVEQKYYWNLSVYASGQMVLGRTTFFADLGYYIVREEIPGQTPNFYQRFGTRIDVYKGIQIGGALRAYNFGIADYIEWSIGYKLGRSKG